MTGPLQPDQNTAAIAVVVGQVLALVIACWIATRTYRGYRETRRRPLLWLAVGIALLAAVPPVVRFVLPTVFAAPSVVTTTIATTSEIAGLLAILYTVYGRP